MRKLLFMLLLLPFLAAGQELTLNKDNSYYEYSTVIETKIPELGNAFEKRLEELNYKNISNNNGLVKGSGFTNHLVGGFATVEIKYQVKIEIKDEKYRLTLTNFILTDKNGSNPLEGMGAFKGKWIRIINTKLPDIVKQLQNLENKKDW